MQESKLEKKFRIAVRMAGGRALKFRPDHKAGMPDRIIVLPNQRCVWAEIKAPGEKLRPLQEKRRRELAQLGHRVFVIDSEQSIRSMIHEIFTTHISAVRN